MLERIKESRRAEGEGGFTLIELLVVIIILGILAAVVVFAVGGVGDKGQQASCKIDTRTIRTAEEAYSARPGGNGDYGSELQLEAGGFLSEQSTYHNITNPTATSFVITIQNGACGGGPASVGEPVRPASGFY